MAAHIAACRYGCGAAEVAQAGLKPLHRLGVGAFLRSEYCGSSLGPGQRIGHVACEAEGRCACLRYDSRGVDGGNLFEGLAAGAERSTRYVGETYAQRCEHAHAAVARTAAAETDRKSVV